MEVPICGCGKVMTCHRTGIRLLTHTEDGLEFQLIAGDDFACSNCGHHVYIVGPNTKPIAEHWEGGFESGKRQARGKLVSVYYGKVPRLTTAVPPPALDASPAASDTPAHGKDHTQVEAGAAGATEEAGETKGK